MGAAIAAGSQGEKGNNALLVIKVSIKRKTLKLDRRDEEKTVKFSILHISRTIETKKKPSPKRFIITVKKPETKED